jgi:hypothetical protein
MGSSVAVVEMVRVVVEGVVLVPLIGRCAAVDDTVWAWLAFNLKKDGGCQTCPQSSGTSD